MKRQFKLVKVIFRRLPAGAPRYSEDEGLADMLRYDHAFQYEDDPTLIAFPVFRTDAGNLGGVVTRDRWRSYGIKVMEPAVPLGGLALLLENKTRWTTFLHPKKEDGTTNFSVLKAVNLEEFLERYGRSR